jgi:hypothetical protein
MQIIILGMHRSGTSLVTRLVNMMGAYVGPEGSMLDLTQDNPKGYWERKDVVSYNVYLLKLHGVDWAGYNPATWPMPHRPKEVPAPLQNSIRALIFNMDTHRPWVVKDPRLCLTLPYWKRLLEVPVCVIVHRDPLEIAESLNKIRHARDPIPHERGIALWEFYATALLNASAELPRLFVSHSDFLQDPVSATARLYHGLSAQGVQALRLPSDREITAFIDPGLYRSKSKRPASQTPASTGYLPGLWIDDKAIPAYRDQVNVLTEHQRQLTAMMRGGSQPQGELVVSEESMRLLQLEIPVIHP